jgi:hypothetical protein
VLNGRLRVGTTIIVFLCSIALFNSCESVPTGPSLSKVTFTPAIETVAGWRASQRPTVLNRAQTALDPTVCCCHVTGTLTNNNTVPVHILVTFAAMTAQNTGAGVGAGEAPPQILYFQRDLQPGESQRIEASGFLLPCASIDHVNYQVNVSSVGVPIL